jgi:hypothetical protein
LRRRIGSFMKVLLALSNGFIAEWARPEGSTLERTRNLAARASASETTSHYESNVYYS